MNLQKKPLIPKFGDERHASAVPPAIRRRAGALDRLNAAHTADPTQKPDGFVQTSGSREKARTVSGGCSHRPHPLLRRRKPGTARSSPVPPGKPGNLHRKQYITAGRELQAKKPLFRKKTEQAGPPRRSVGAAARRGLTGQGGGSPPADSGSAPRGRSPSGG